MKRLVGSALRAAELAWRGALRRSRRDSDGRPRIYVVRGAGGLYASGSDGCFRVTKRFASARRVPSVQRAIKVARLCAVFLGPRVQVRKVSGFGMWSVLVEELRV